jgi:hydrogenase-4 component F
VSSDPVVAAALLACIANYRVSARINCGELVCHAARCGCRSRDQAPDRTLLFIDDLNVVFIVVNAFVGFTTSVFSASYIGHEIDSGR